MLQPCLLTCKHAQATVPVISLLLMSTSPPRTLGTLPVPIVQQTEAPCKSHSKKADSFKKTRKAGLLAEHANLVLVISSHTCLCANKNMCALNIISAP